MSNFYTQTNSAVRRVHKRFAHEFTVYQYAWDDTAGSNAYADGDWTKTSTTVQATLRRPDEPITVPGPDGNDIETDVSIFVTPDVSIETGTGDESRATEFVDSRTGQRYRAFASNHQESLIEVFCELI